MLLFGDNFSLIRARSLSSRLFKVTVHFIQVGLSRPNSSKKSIAKLNTGLSLCTSPTRPA